MSKSTISSELEAEQLLTSQNSRVNLWTEHQYPLRGLGGPHSQSGRFGKEKNFVPNRTGNRLVG